MSTTGSRGRSLTKPTLVIGEHLPESRQRERETEREREREREKEFERERERFKRAIAYDTRTGEYQNRESHLDEIRRFRKIKDFIEDNLILSDDSAIPRDKIYTQESIGYIIDNFEYSIEIKLIRDEWIPMFDMFFSNLKKNTLVNYGDFRISSIGKRKELSERLIYLKRIGEKIYTNPYSVLYDCMYYFSPIIKDKFHLTPRHLTELEKKMKPTGSTDEARKEVHVNERHKEPDTDDATCTGASCGGIFGWLAGRGGTRRRNKKRKSRNKKSKKRTNRIR
jgi:hypothetical protein